MRAAAETTVTAGLDQIVEIETPEQVAFSYTVAGIGSRAAAALIDHGIIVGAMILVILLDLFVIAPNLDSFSATAQLARKTGGWVFAVLMIVQFVLQWGYYVLFEALWDGQTPGKRWLGLRVVRDGGFSVGFSSAAARNVARVLDMQPGLSYLVGIISVAVSRTGKRTGDQLAGTIVVREKLIPLAELPELEGANRAQAEATAALTDAELELLERFMSRLYSLEPVRAAALKQQIVERFRAHLDDTTSPIPALRALIERERLARARGVGARGRTGAAREQYRIIAEGMPRWTRFGQRTRIVQQRGLSKLSAEEVADFVAQYREVASDLARLSTATRGTNNNVVFQLSRLVASGHNLLYREKRLAAHQVSRFLLHTVPRELQQSLGPIALAALLLFGSGAAAFLGVVNSPVLIEQMVSPHMIDRAEQDAARAASGDRRYIDVEEYERPILSTRVLTNNVRVAFVVFASGLTAGVMTVIVLLLNGVSIGSVFGLFATKGVLPIIGGFAIAHSVFELTAICIAAAAGFLIASAILLPGARTRREALVSQGQRALRLLAAATLFLLFAGAIEGLISPRVDLSFAFKAVVAAISGLMILLYASLGFRALRAP